MAPIRRTVLSLKSSSAHLLLHTNLKMYLIENLNAIFPLLNPSVQMELQVELALQKADHNRHIHSVAV